MEKICVIGGSGFVGTRLIEQLGKDRCYNIDKNPSPYYNEISILQNICSPGLDKAFSIPARTVVLLAAEHRDDVSPVSLYYEVNVQGTEKVLETMDKNDIKNIIFTSSVAIYGLNKNNPDEGHLADPFNHYGKSKWAAEKVLRNWYKKDPDNRSVTIIRPTVIFGERNRGNVYNLLNQIATGKFLMVGNGINYKSMAYVGNVVAFIDYLIQNTEPGYQVFNYVDKPDLNMTELVSQVEQSLSKKIPSTHIPKWLGMLGGFGFDALSKVSGRKFSVSSVRIRKFCATTQFDATAAHNCGFVAPYSLDQGFHKTLHYEFIEKIKDGITFESE